MIHVKRNFKTLKTGFLKLTSAQQNQFNVHNLIIFSVQYVDWQIVYIASAYSAL